MSPAYTAQGPGKDGGVTVAKTALTIRPWTAVPDRPGVLGAWSLDVDLRVPGTTGAGLWATLSPELARMAVLVAVFPAEPHDGTWHPTGYLDGRAVESLGISVHELGDDNVPLKTSIVVLALATLAVEHWLGSGGGPPTTILDVLAECLDPQRGRYKMISANLARSAARRRAGADR